ncbi:MULTISPECIES: hypothetical protein [unclassified Burkholderia]|uniref:hypothetical protein n=1 Tax=unclassified Burkholderia TaxID=2613784 RepID=UPI0015C646FE|nr:MULTISPECIES: hypothetical protein [unclassified Burkholderia]
MESEVTEINRVWSAVYAHPAWSVKQGHGSFLTIEFGQPELQIREPMDARPEASPKVRESLARRLVTVTGNWHLWIYCCKWVISANGTDIARSESSDSVIALATQKIDGQKILSVTQGASPGSWVFSFDLGGEIRTHPYNEDPLVEQWYLFERESGKVLAVRADDRFSYEHGNIAPDNKIWNPIDKNARCSR